MTELLNPNSLVDELRNAQARLDALSEQLEHSHRLATLGTLAAGIAHEINNILTPVLAYAQLAQQNPGDQALHAKALAKAVQGVETATQITQAMLGFGSNPREHEQANVASVIQSALDCIGRHPSKDRIDVAINVPDGMTVNIRPLALQQVLVNLILNACSAMRRTGGELIIAATPTDAETVQIKVIDNGPGISPDVAGRLFQPFVSTRKQSFRSRKSTASSTLLQGGDLESGGFESSADGKPGTGLGLAICRQLIEAAGGTILATSAVGKGASFSISLPGKLIRRAKAG